MTGGSLADPPAASVILAAVGWVQGTLLGTLATVIAIIAVALVGIAMLSGRIDIRRGIMVLIGCFLLFGAPRIAPQLSGGAGDYGVRPAPPVVAAPPPKLIPPPNPNYDPYAGAAVPQR